MGRPVKFLIFKISLGIYRRTHFLSLPNLFKIQQRKVNIAEAAAANVRVMLEPAGTQVCR